MPGLKINSIKASGFLSFENIEINNLSESVNFIVGPNGSGKTNIVRLLKFIKSELELKPLHYPFIVNPYQYRENYLKSGAISASLELETEIIFENEEEKDILINLTAIMLRNFLKSEISFFSDKRDEYFLKAVESSKTFWERLKKGTLRIEFNKSNGLTKTYEPKDNNGINGDNGLRINLSNDNIITGFNVKQSKSVATKLQELTSSIENESDRYNKIIEYFGSGSNDNDSIWYELRLNNIDTGYGNINLGQEKFQNINEFLKNNKIDTNGQISISQIFSIIFADSIIILEGIRGLSDTKFTLQEIKESKFEIKTIFAFLFKLKFFYPKQYKEVRKRFEELSAGKDFDILIKDFKEETILLKEKKIPITVFPSDALKIVNEEVLKEKLLLELQFSDSESAGYWYPSEFAPAGYYEMLLLSILIAGVKNSVIVLDEPAQNLHPAFQKKLLFEIDIYSKDNRNQFFIITHSPYLIPSNFMDSGNRETKLFRFFKDAGEASTKLISINESVNNNDLSGLRATIRANIDRIIRAPFANLVIIVEGIEEEMTLPDLLSLYCDFNIADYGIEIINSHGKGNVDKYANIFKSWEINTLSIKDKDRDTNSAVSNSNPYEYYWDNYNNYTELICSILEESINNGIDLDEKTKTEINKECVKGKPFKTYLNSLLLDNLDKISKETIAKANFKKLSDFILERMGRIKP